MLRGLVDEQDFPLIRGWIRRVVVYVLWRLYAPQIKASSGESHSLYLVRALRPPYDESEAFIKADDARPLSVTETRKFTAILLLWSQPTGAMVFQT